MISCRRETSKVAQVHACHGERFGAAATAPYFLSLYVRDPNALADPVR